ncbi:MAG: TRAP transporter substrate-binding protein DctP [Rhodospirillaceae bacterium]|nr:TRAP transporter substrate-binding protein DctP [Rhodospirillaceae bacterium]MBT5768563.1 TRAP transporter substrate-binding protein DctP [Rhodospirillaceae bacterium]MBT6308190.1 TRAP transporter substrate-binding protein DctP [Rhodospirillaceae bacterium]MBT7365714.1 TRAP transporter substrate-binding protein DctP [Rhodospirillaceae bacterium]
MMIKSISALAVIGLLTVPSLATAQETIKLKFHSSFGESPLNEAPRWWMDEVEKRTDGRVKFTRILGGALGKLTAAPENIKVGAFDMGNVSVVYNPGLFSLSNVVSLPFISDDPLVHAKAAHELHNTTTNDEFKAMGQKYLGPGMWTRIQMLSHEPIRTIDDLKKQKIRAHGGASELLKTLGITVYGIPWGELPAAAERKVVTAGIIGAPADAYAFGFGKIFKYWDQEDWFLFPLTYTMNQDSWDALPDDIKTVMEEVNEEMVVEGRKLMAAQEAKSGPGLASQVEIVKFEEMDKLIAARDQTWQNWVDARKAEGKDGQAVLDTFLALLDKHK